MKNLTSKLWIQALLALILTGEALAESAHHVAEPGVEHGSDSGGLPQLNPEWFPSQIFWIVITFVSLYFIFSRKILPGISSAIENRREHVQGNLDTAQELKEEAEKVHSAYDEIVEEARNRASALFSEVENEIKDKINKEFDAFRKSSGNKSQTAEKEIEAAKNAAMKEMNSFAAEIAAQAAEKIVGISADIDQAKSVVQNIKKKAA